MIDPIESLAKRVKDDPFFLAPLLCCYAESEGLDDEGLARLLNCSLEALNHLRICRPPRLEAALFRQDVERIAVHVGLDFEKLVDVIRFGQALQKMRENQAKHNALFAAREGDEPDGNE